MTADTSSSQASEPSAAAAGMGERTRCHDWSATPLGPRDAWPQSLRTTVDIMLASGHGMCVMWGERRTFLYNDAYAAFLGQRHPAALGMRAEEVWMEVWSDIAPLVARTFAGETSTFFEFPLTMTRNGSAEETWWDFSYSPIHDEGGNVAGLLNVAFDASARVSAERQRDIALADLRASEAFVRSVLASSADCIKVLEPDGTVSFMNEGGLRAMEISDFNDVKGCPWPTFLKEEGPVLAREALDAARLGRSSVFVTPGDTFGGTAKFWSVSVTPILGADGRTDRILAVSRDITELEEAREQQGLLNAELAHRVKNTMSVVQAIANQTIGKVASDEAMRAFGDRLGALAASHNLLTGQHWSTARLDELVHEVLSTFGASRFACSGPPLDVGPHATLALALMLHELATNAVKYGALSVPDGKVQVSWAVRPRDGADRLELTWEERGGPPATVPTRKGFGSRIIQMGIVGSGGVNLHYGSDGLRVEAGAPLHRVQQA